MVDAIIVEGWEFVSHGREHRPGATRADIRSTQWRGERIASVFMQHGEGKWPEVCELCDLFILEGQEHPFFPHSHAACVLRAIKLIMERRPALPGYAGHWGLLDLRVAEPGSTEAESLEERRSRAKSEMTAEQQEEATFLRAMAGSGE